MSAPEELIPPHILKALQGWGDGSRPFAGDFVRAVLSNDLVEAVGRADAESMAALKAIVQYVYCELPSVCWGSPEKVKAWAIKHQGVKT